MPITRPLTLRVECCVDLDVIGADSAILLGSEPLLTIAEEALPTMLLRPLLTPLSHQMAAHIGEQLHHAEWTITTDPQVVEEIGMHGRPSCGRCRAGVNQALAHLRETPGRPMIVGILHWAGTRQSPGDGVDT